MMLAPRRSVLVVDDEAAFAQTVAECLEDEGFVVRTALDVPAALAAVGQHRPDVVLSDIWLPGASGWDLAERLIERGEGIPLVLMSAMAVQAGTPRLSFVRKGDGVDRILAAVHAALERPAA
jgi:two-component system, NtrC family, nitrogen regulation response regulator NtrX